MKEDNIDEPHIDSSDIHIIEHNARTFILVGTAHISQESTKLVKLVIEKERPDMVCIELDQKRFNSMTKKKQWQALDLKEIIKKKQLATLAINLFLSSYQKKLGNQLGVKPGTELLTAANIAKDNNIPISLCDRDSRITLRRAWKSTSLFKKGYLLSTIGASLFDDTELSEEKLTNLRKQDILTELLNSIGDVLPGVKQVLIDERDIYLSEKIKSSQGRRIVAVMGAGHIAGVKKAILTDNSAIMDELSTIPPISKKLKIAGWLIPGIIIGSIYTIGVQKGFSAAEANIIYWILANGIPSSIGGVLALAHPLTSISVFFAAPLTSLTPVIGAGYIAAFVQVMKRPPNVLELENAGENMTTIKGWWTNKLLRIILVFFFTGFGSVIGTWVGGYEIFRNLTN